MKSFRKKIWNRKRQKTFSFVFCVIYAFMILSAGYNLLLLNSYSARAEAVTTVNQDGVYYEYEKTLKQSGDGLYEVRLTASAHYTKSEASRIRTAVEECYITVEKDGNYLLELWGGDGGNGANSSESLGGSGGKAGHIYGQIYLKAGQTLVFTVGSNGEQTLKTDEGGGENGGGGHGGSGSYGVGGGGGYSAIYLFDKGQFEAKYIDDAGVVNYKLDKNDRFTKYIMIAGGGGGGGAGNSWPYSTKSRPNGGGGGNLETSISGKLSGSAHRVNGVYFAGGNGFSSGTSFAYVGQGGKDIPGKVVSTALGEYRGEQPNDWEGTYNESLSGGAGGAGNFRGGAGGAGFTGGSGGIMNAMLIASNVGGGGGGASFIADNIVYQNLSDDVRYYLANDNFSDTGGAFVYTFLGEEDQATFDPSFLDDIKVSGSVSKYFDILAVESNTGDVSYDSNTGNLSVKHASIAPNNIGFKKNVLDLVVKLRVKDDFAGGNDVPLFTDEGLLLIPSGGKSVVEIENNDETDYINVPLKMPLVTKSFVVGSGATIELNQLYESIEDASGWKYDFIDTMGEIEVYLDGVLQTSSQVITQKTTYIVQYSVTPKPGSKAIFGEKAKSMLVSNKAILDVFSFASGNWDSINLQTSSFLEVLYDNDPLYESFKSAAGNADISRGLYYLELNINDIDSRMVEVDSITRIESDYTESAIEYTQSVVKANKANPLIYRDTAPVESGDEQKTFTVPVSGYYMIEARGGDGADNSNDTGKGGSGGLVYGVYYLEAGEELYYAVGSNGTRASSDTGGLPGGGKTTEGQTMAGGGGGYTIISKNTLSATRDNESSVLNDAYLVAGAGGGAARANNSTSVNGGAGGSMSSDSSAVSGGRVYNGGDGKSSIGNNHGYGGSTTGGAGAEKYLSYPAGDAGSFLQGGAASTRMDDNLGAFAGGGGGGGYYGGGGGIYCYTVSKRAGGGGGGSSFVKNSADYSSVTSTIPTASLTTSGISIYLLTDSEGKLTSENVTDTSTEDKHVLDDQINNSEKTGYDLNGIGLNAEVSKYFSALGALKGDANSGYAPLEMSNANGKISIDDLNLNITENNTTEERLLDDTSQTYAYDRKDDIIQGTVDRFDYSFGDVTVNVANTPYTKISYEGEVSSDEYIVTSSTDYTADDFTVIILLAPKSEFWGGNDVPVFLTSDVKNAEWSSKGPGASITSDMALTKSGDRAPSNYYLEAEDKADYANVKINKDFDDLFSAEDVTITCGESVNLESQFKFNLRLPSGSDAWQADYVNLISPNPDPAIVSPRKTASYQVDASIVPKTNSTKAIVASEATAVEYMREATVYVQYSVTYALDNMTHDDVTTVMSGDGLSTGILPQSGYDLVGDVTVKVGGEALSPDDFEYDSKTGALIIPEDKVDNNIIITASAQPKKFELIFLYESYDGATGNVETDIHKEEYLAGDPINSEWFRGHTSSPRPGHDFVWDWATSDGNPLQTMPGQTWYVTGSYVPKRVELTVRYMDESHTNIMFESHVEVLPFNSEYRVISPVMPGYLADKLTVSGILTDDTVITVTYAPSNNTLTIIYLYEDTNEEVPNARFSGIFQTDQSYDIPSPEITGYTADGDVSGIMTADSVTKLVYYKPNEYAVTFDPGEGAVCETDEKSVVYNNIYGYDPAEESYEALPTPIKPGAQFKGWYDEFGNLIIDETIVTISGDHTLRAEWEVNAFELTVKYEYDDGEQAFETVNESLEPGVYYNVEIFDIEGYTAKYTPEDIPLSGSMPARNITIIVTYTGEYTLTVEYYYDDTLNDANLAGTQAADTHTEALKRGEAYSIESPEINNSNGAPYLPGRKVVSGIMPAEDLKIRVIYYDDLLISVTVEWGELSYDYYSGNWDAQNHTYEGYSTNPTHKDSNKIRVTNNDMSTMPIQVNLSNSMLSNFDTLGRWFTDTNNSNGNSVSSFRLDVDQTKDAWLWLDGVIADGLTPEKYTPVGSAVVTISELEENE